MSYDVEKPDLKVVDAPKTDPDDKKGLTPTDRLNEYFKEANMTKNEQNLYKIGFMIVKNDKNLSQMSSKNRSDWIHGFINGNLYRMRREFHMIKSINPVNQELMTIFFESFEKSLMPGEEKK